MKIIDAGPAHRAFVKALSGVVFTRFGDYETMLPALFDLPWIRTSIANLEGKPVGFTMVSTEDMAVGVFDLVAIAVEPDSASSGVGRRLLAHVEAEARRCVRYRPAVVRLTVATDNTRALDLFRRSGYARYGEGTGTYAGGQTSIEMAKILTG